MLFQFSALNYFSYNSEQLLEVASVSVLEFSG